MVSEETCEKGAIIRFNHTSPLITGATYRYRLDGKTGFQTSPEFVILDLDPTIHYAITVDRDGCNFTATAPSTLKPYVPIQIVGDPIITPPTCHDGTGTIKITVTPKVDGRTYIYRLVDSTGALVVPDTKTTSLTGEIIGIPPGTNYEIRVIDEAAVDKTYEGCFAFKKEVDLNAPSEITVTSIIKHITCDPNEKIGNILGEITLTVTGGTTISGASKYTYEVLRNGAPFSTPLGTGNQVTITDLLAAEYTFIITDRNGCFIESKHRIRPNIDGLKVDIIPSPPGTICIDGYDLEVEIKEGSDLFPYYSIEIVGDPASKVDLGLDPLNPTLPLKKHTFTGLEFAKTYVIKATDLKTKCTWETDPITRTLGDLAVTAALDKNNHCFGNDNKSVDITVTGYDNTDPAGQSFDWRIMRVDIPADVLVATGIQVAIGDPSVFKVSATLPRGIYYVKITEKNGKKCSDRSFNFDVDVPLELKIQLAPGETQESCPGNNGSFRVLASNGVGAITYSVTTLTPIVPPIPNNDTGVFDNLPANTYTVTATDANNCSVDSDPYTVKPAIPIVQNPLVTTPITCFNSNNATITASATGGLPGSAYQYILTKVGEYTNAPVPSPKFENLSAGTYRIKVIGDLDCESTEMTATFINPPEFKAEATKVREEDCIDKTADVTVTVTGITAAEIKEYKWTNIENPTLTGTSPNPTFVKLPPGLYQFYAINNFDCESLLSAGIKVYDFKPIAFELDESSKNTLCFDSNNGTIDIKQLSLSGGKAPYKYKLEGNLDDGTKFGPIEKDESKFEDLKPGGYDYTIISLANCETTKPFRVESPPEFKPEITPINVSCFGSGDGSIRIVATGGTPPYYFAINDEPFLDESADDKKGEHTFKELTKGIYKIIVQDKNGCDEVRDDIEITEPDALEIIEIEDSHRNETCLGDSDGAFEITVSGGTLTPPEEYETSLDPITGFVAGKFIYENLPSGETKVYVRDSNKCVSEKIITIGSGVILDATLSSRMDCPIIGISGAILEEPVYYIDFELGPTSANTDITYKLTGINGTPNPVPNTNSTGTFIVAPGEYEGELEHTISNCKKPAAKSIEIEEYIVLSDLKAVPTNNMDDLNEYKVTVKGGKEGYLYFLTFKGNKVFEIEEDQRIEKQLDTNIFSIRESGTYILRVEDSNRCEIIAEQFLTYINIKIENHFTPNGDGTNDYWYPEQISEFSTDPFYFTKMEVKIFDRYGRLIEQYLGEQRGWDGTYQGKALPSGDYWFYIILNDIDERKIPGHFTLYR